MIQEIVSALFVDGVQKRADVAGQISMKGRLRGMFKAEAFNFVVHGRSDMETLLPNKAYIDSTLPSGAAGYCVGPDPPNLPR